MSVAVKLTFQLTISAPLQDDVGACMQVCACAGEGAQNNMQTREVQCLASGLQFHGQAIGFQKLPAWAPGFTGDVDALFAVECSCKKGLWKVVWLRSREAGRTDSSAAPQC